MTATVVMVLVVVAVALVVVLLIIRAPDRGTAVVLPPAPPLTATDALAAFAEAPPPPPQEQQHSVDLPVPLDAAPPAPGWTALVTDDHGVLDADARIRLLADLGIVRAPWCVPIIVRAYDEERDPAVRRAALEALSGFRNSPAARAALERATSHPPEASNGAASNGAHAG
jgi:hypothetical protein